MYRFIFVLLFLLSLYAIQLAWTGNCRDARGVHVVQSRSSAAATSMSTSPKKTGRVRFLATKTERTYDPPTGTIVADTVKLI